MDVVVNFDLCEANGVCEQFAPDTFTLNDDDELEVATPVEDAEEIDRVRRAVAACPRAALALTEK
ncbi:MAG: ferredoxin [Rhodococcus sp. (in: high G+C Gram-positive bacteria)]